MYHHSYVMFIVHRLNSPKERNQMLYESIYTRVVPKFKRGLGGGRAKNVCIYTINRGREISSQQAHRKERKKEKNGHIKQKINDGRSRFIGSVNYVSD